MQSNLNAAELTKLLRGTPAISSRQRLVHLRKCLHWRTSMLVCSYLFIDSLQILNANLGIIDSSCENLETGQVSPIPFRTSDLEDGAEHGSNGNIEDLPRIYRTGLQCRAR